MNVVKFFRYLCKIKYYGAFAAALGFSIHSVNKKRKDMMKGDKLLYRGLRPKGASSRTSWRLPRSGPFLSKFLKIRRHKSNKCIKMYKYM